ncbi:MAG: hypothetical protein CSB47_01465 [Proteobacteria bacterium]|nr:MAG: hypothetical protein CSB47_01465 [Pseudomonadota bacterium]
MGPTVDTNHYHPTTTPTKHYSEVNIFSTDGRIGRLEYFFYSTVIPILAFWIIVALAGIASHFGELGGAIAHVLLAAGFCVAIIIYIQLTIQRCHDFNASGWITLLLLLPLASVLFWIIPGNATTNRFGDPTPPPSLLLKMGAGCLLLVIVAICTFLALNYFSS